MTKVALLRTLRTGSKCPECLSSQTAVSALSEVVPPSVVAQWALHWAKVVFLSRSVVVANSKAWLLWLLHTLFLCYV